MTDKNNNTTINASAYDDAADLTDANLSPAITNPPTWEAVAALGEIVGADAHTPWMVTVETENGKTRTVVTETLRGSDDDGMAGFDPIGYGDRESHPISAFRRVSPLLDADGEVIEAGLDVTAVWDAMRLEDLLETLD